MTGEELGLYALMWLGGALVLLCLLHMSRVPRSWSLSARAALAGVAVLAITAGVAALRAVTKRKLSIEHARARSHGVKMVSTSQKVVPKLRRPKRAGAAAAATSPSAGAAPPDEPAQPIPVRSEEHMDDEHDYAQSLIQRGSGRVGEVRNAAFSARVMPRQKADAQQYLGGVSSAGKLADMLSFEGMRKFTDTTLYAREAYKTHQYDEAGEGMDQRYEDPSLLSYDPAFVAYSEQPFLAQRQRLSTRAPAHF
jgi:type IV secretory pathway VirB10-like protein